MAPEPAAALAATSRAGRLARRQAAGAANTSAATNTPTAAAFLADENRDYFVFEEMLNDRERSDGVREFFSQWNECSESNNPWEPEEHLDR